MNLVVGGRQVGGIVTLSDGTPINVGQIGTPNAPEAQRARREPSVGQ